MNLSIELILIVGCHVWRAAALLKHDVFPHDNAEEDEGVGDGDDKCQTWA